MTEDIFNNITPPSFESTRTPAVDVYLRFQDDIADKWNSNQKNTLRFEELKSILTRKSVVCYFQKDKPFITKKNQKEIPQHSILIPVNEGRAIKIQASLWEEKPDLYTHLYSYGVNKSYEVPFVNVPDEDVYIAECSIRIITRSLHEGSNSPDFINLYKAVDELNIPAVSINKERDVAIWDKYVFALNELVKAKEQVWKVRDFRGPYTKRNVNGENDYYFDFLVVGEKEKLENQLRAFLDEQSENYELKMEDNESISIEYRGYKKLYQSDEESLKKIGQEYCYIFDSQPTYTSTGELTISHANSESIRMLYDDFCSYLEKEYKIKISIEPNGKITCYKKDIKHVLTVAERRYSDSFIIEKNTEIRLKVDFKIPRKQSELEVLRDYKSAVDKNSSRVFSIDTKELIIDAPSSEEYKNLVAEVAEIKGATIQKKPYNPTYYIKLNPKLEEMRRQAIMRIQDRLREQKFEQYCFDTNNEYIHTTIKFCYQTDEYEERFTSTLRELLEEEFSDKYDLAFNSCLITTKYQLLRDVEAAEEKERKLMRDIRQIRFRFLGKDQYKPDSDSNQTDDDEKGVVLGTLKSKNNDMFTFLLDSTFKTVVESREDIHKLKEGYIKPDFIGELTVIKRMTMAMGKVTKPELKGYPVNPNLSNFIFDSNTAGKPETDIEEEKMEILRNLNEPLLRNQPRQLEAVAKAMIAPDMAIIQGPPGTGKTTVIAEIIWQTLLKNPEARILITSQTNLAVDNALERLKGKKLVRPIRIGNVDRFEDGGKMYSKDCIDVWANAMPGSLEEQLNNNNAVNEWIDSIIRNAHQDSSHSEIVKKWIHGLEQKNITVKQAFATEYFNHVNVFAATCSECGSLNFSKIYKSIFEQGNDEKSDPVFDIVIMDEASKATPPELILPLTLGKKVVIIGDHKQLPPMIDEKEFVEALDAVGAKDLVNDWTKGDYKISQFEKLFVHAPESIVTTLDTQFRMHEKIMKCISQFYQDQKELEDGLKCGITDQMDNHDFKNKASRWHGLDKEPFIRPDIHAIWVNVETPEEDPKGNHSYRNVGEIEAIHTVLRALTHANGFEDYLANCQKPEDKEIGVITYYGTQMTEIRKALYPTFRANEWRNFEAHKYENEFQVPFRINTVDRFQGMERNIIIISTVRSNRRLENGVIQKNEKYPEALGFARECPRINVGFSRAKRLLIVIGNQKHFAHREEYKKAIDQMHQIDIEQLKN